MVPHWRTMDRGGPGGPGDVGGGVGSNTTSGGPAESPCRSRPVPHGLGDPRSLALDGRGDGDDGAHCAATPVRALEAFNLAGRGNWKKQLTPLTRPDTCTAHNRHHRGPNDGGVHRLYAGHRPIEGRAEEADVPHRMAICYSLAPLRIMPRLATRPGENYGLRMLLIGGGLRPLTPYQSVKSRQTEPSRTGAPGGCTGTSLLRGSGGGARRPSRHRR